MQAHGALRTVVQSPHSKEKHWELEHPKSNIIHTNTTNSKKKTLRFEHNKAFEPQKLVAIRASEIPSDASHEWVVRHLEIKLEQSSDERWH
jgi:hypothetical protein